MQPGARPSALSSLLAALPVLLSVAGALPSAGGCADDEKGVEESGSSSGGASGTGGGTGAEGTGGEGGGDPLGVNSSCGSATCCEFPYDTELTDPAGELLPAGAHCTADAQCATTFCLLPGEDGNITNSLFGFCTRGCNCNDDTASQLSAEDKPSYECLLVSGGQGAWRHVVPSCKTPADCAEHAAGWNACKAPSTGGIKPICHAE